MTPPSAAGLVCALWDHAITLDDEIELVWKKKWDVTKFAFFFYRYGAEGSLIYVNYSTCAHMSYARH